jgi:hypothetical protein
VIDPDEEEAGAWGEGASDGAGVLVL